MYLCLFLVFVFISVILFCVYTLHLASWLQFQNRFQLSSVPLAANERVCLSVHGSGLYELWKTGRYKSYPPSILVDLTARILALVPPWTRVYRVQRSVPCSLCLCYIITVIFTRRKSSFFNS